VTDVDDALSHADEALEVPRGAAYVSVRRDALDLLVRWIRVMRPVQAPDPGDFHHWQNIIDEARTKR
jgi:hypothetical protein